MRRQRHLPAALHGQGRDHAAGRDATTASPAPTRAPPASPSTCAARGPTRSTRSSTSRSARVDHGDVFDRYKVRIDERCASRVKIVEQCLDMLPKGPVQLGSLRAPYVITPPPGACYVGQENPRGEYGTYIESDGSRYPYRLKFRDPCFCNLQLFPKLLQRQQDRRRHRHLGQHRPRAGRDRPLMDIFLGILRAILFVVIAYTVVFVAALVNIVFERRVLAFMQDRLGPNRTGPQGVLQSVADAFKMMGKEDFRPSLADPVLFTLAPVMVMIGAVAVQLVLPYTKGLTAAGPQRRPHLHRRHHRLHDDGDPARRLVVAQQVLAGRRAALRRADDQLRDPHDPRPARRGHDRRLAQPQRRRRRAGALPVDRLLRAVHLPDLLHRLASPS